SVMEASPPKELEPIAEQIRQFARSESTDSQVWERFVELFREQFLPTMLRRTIFNGEPLPDKLKENLPPARAAQLERAGKEFRGEAAAESTRTVKAMVDGWDAHLKAQVAIAAITATRYDRIIQTLRHFSTFIGETADVKVIDAERLEGFYN